jgi:hypothetical protein
MRSFSTFVTSLKAHASKWVKRKGKPALDEASDRSMVCRGLPYGVFAQSEEELDKDKEVRGKGAGWDSDRVMVTGEKETDHHSPREFRSRRKVMTDNSVKPLQVIQDISTGGPQLQDDVHSGLENQDAQLRFNTQPTTHQLHADTFSPDRVTGILDDDQYEASGFLRSDVDQESHNEEQHSDSTELSLMDALSSLHLTPPPNEKAQMSTTHRNAKYLPRIQALYHFLMNSMVESMD